MKRKFNLVLGLIMLIDLVYKIVSCPGCEDNILWFQVPGFVKILFLAILTIGLLYPVYREITGQLNLRIQVSRFTPNFQ